MFSIATCNVYIYKTSVFIKVNFYLNDLIFPVVKHFDKFIEIFLSQMLIIRIIYVISARPFFCIGLLLQLNDSIFHNKILFESTFHRFEGNLYSFLTN